ncbi:MAG: CRISPR-associated endonuclease Cas2 [Bacteroidota bacterium]
MIYLICYDIENDRLRKKIADKLEAEGLERLQYSVFLGPVTLHQYEKLVKWLGNLIREKGAVQDRINILHVKQEDLEKMITFGKQSVDIALMTGKENTLFL